MTPPDLDPRTLRWLADLADMEVAAATLAYKRNAEAANGNPAYESFQGQRLFRAKRERREFRKLATRIERSRER